MTEEHLFHLDLAGHSFDGLVYIGVCRMARVTAASWGAGKANKPIATDLFKMSADLGKHLDGRRRPFFRFGL